MENKYSLSVAALMCCFCACLFSSVVFSQDLPFARKIVDTLSSPSMHGRGYVNRGDSIAAEFIKFQFYKLGAKPLEGGDYFQRFDFPVNTFPGAMNITTEKRVLMPGKDFIVNPACVSINGTFDLVWLKKEDLQNRRKLGSLRKNPSVKVIVIEINSDEEQKEILQFIASLPTMPAAVFRITNKLTWSVSQKAGGIMLIDVIRSSLPKADKKVTILIENKFINAYPTQNVIGQIQGSEKPDSFIVFCAHYDHLGRMGSSTYFPGANDNGSGIAVMLDLMQYFSKPENKPKYTLLFIAFAAEEAGLVGSKYYNDHPPFPLARIRFLINLDLMGNGNEGITVVNATEFMEEHIQLRALNKGQKYVTEIKSRGKAANSDHHYFTENGVRCFFIYTLGGSKAYHDIYDDSQTLPFSAYENVFKLLVDFTSYLENKP